jgi:hypothetical protein
MKITSLLLPLPLWVTLGCTASAATIIATMANDVTIKMTVGTVPRLTWHYMC